MRAMQRVIAAHASLPRVKIFCVELREKPLSRSIRHCTRVQDVDIFLESV